MTDMKPSTNIQFLDHGIYVAQAGQRKKLVADPIQVVAFGTSDQGKAQERAFTVLKFMNRRGKLKEEIVPSSMLTAQSGPLIALLSTRGYTWPPNQTLRAQIIGALSIEKPARHIRVTDVPGHHGKFFVLPGESYGPNGPDRKRLQINYNPTVSLGEFQRLKTLDGWKKYIPKKMVHSSRARLAMGTLFAAPTLRLLNIDSFGFNFFGETSGGKTLLLRYALSGAGLNSSRGPATWDGSAPAFEQRALGHRDCVMPLDDLSHLQGDATKMAKIITFRLASNKPKAKAGQYVAAHNLSDMDWRIVVLSTSEDPLRQSSNLNVSRRIRGEDVRLIDVPACVSDLNDIFDGPNARKKVGATVDERALFVQKVERWSLKYQGVALRKYLAKLMADKSAKATLEGYMDRYREEAPLPVEGGWLTRIRRTFEVAYAANALAIDYGILPWGKKQTLADIRSCMNDAMKHLVAISGANSNPNSATARSPNSMLAKFKKLVDHAMFVNMHATTQGAPLTKRLKKASGIIRSTKNGKQCLLFGKQLDAWFPDVTVRKNLTKLLRDRKIFGRGRRRVNRRAESKI
jgi:uncharacterized protein (DUF927 family)